MPQTIKIDNFASLNLKEATQLDADYAATGSTASLLVKNSQDIAVNDYALIGQPGGETTELQQVTAVADTTHFSVAQLTKAHLRFDKIYTLFGDKIRIYRAAAGSDNTPPADGSFSLLATVSIDTDQPTTSYTDAAGTSGYWYKYTYYNSTATTETSLADTKAARGGGVYHYGSVDAIRAEAGLKTNKWITDAQISQARDAAEAEINSALSGLYTIPFTDPINPLITQITRKIAAGLVLTNDFGPLSSTTTKNGESKLAEGRALLNKLNTKELVLTDVNGSSTVLSGAGGFSAWPDNTTAEAEPEDGGNPRMFRTSDRY